MEPFKNLPHSPEIKFSSHQPKSKTEKVQEVGVGEG